MLPFEWHKEDKGGLTVLLIAEGCEISDFQSNKFLYFFSHTSSCRGTEISAQNWARYLKTGHSYRMHKILIWKHYQKIARLYNSSGRSTTQKKFSEITHSSGWQGYWRLTGTAKWHFAMTRRAVMSEICKIVRRNRFTSNSRHVNYSYRREMATIKLWPASWAV